MKVLAIVEVASKQKYIFSSKYLKDNINRSNEIRFVTESRYLESISDSFNEENNLVYSGGGHAILCFDSLEEGRSYLEKYSLNSRISFPNMEIYQKLKEYQDDMKLTDMINDLKGELEKKKKSYFNSFEKGTFGIEKRDKVTFMVQKDSRKIDDETIKDEFAKKLENQFNLTTIQEKLIVDDKEKTLKGQNFVSIVHIDGNKMGKRTSDLYERINKENKSFDETRRELKAYSEAIDNDFKDALYEVITYVDQFVKGEEGIVPIRPLIYAGDDICFITAGPIGLLCAEKFMEAISKKKNKVDNKPYAVCAGVAMVHISYPFYSAYELSEELCSSAKRYGEELDESGRVSLIDWHIEYGQLKSSLEEIREDYITNDNQELYLRPYVVNIPTDLNIEPDAYRLYESYKNLSRLLKSKVLKYPRTKIKGLREALKKGTNNTNLYLKERNIDNDFKYLAPESYIKDKRKDINNVEKLNEYTEIFRENKCMIFDAIETMDCVIVDVEDRDEK